jgi:hypothetical protein
MPNKKRWTYVENIMEITISPTENPHETSPTALGPGIAHADGILDASQL